MNRAEIETLLRDHLRSVHEELRTLMRGVERALDNHLARTEQALADAMASESEDTDARTLMRPKIT